MPKTWKILSQLKSKDPKNRQEEIVKVLLKNRGIKTPKQQQEFFKSRSPTRIPLQKTGISVTEVEKAIKRIKRAKKEKELVVIYGDFDADGITATAVLWETLFNLGFKALPFIPDREIHSHGLKKKGVEAIISDLGKPGLIITVDNGIVAFTGARFCRKQGIDLIICDHHQVKISNIKYQISKRKIRNFKEKLPEALAIIHSDKLAGAGVTWFFSREILKSYHRPSIISHELLQLTAIGTVADIFPLIGVNRCLVKFGLEILKKTKRVGIKSLLSQAKIDQENINTHTIGFIIAPRLNAMGRLKHALDSLRLLCTKDEKRGVKLALSLGETNKERQNLTLSSFEHAMESSKLKAQSSKLLIIAHESYEEGVIGLVAGKLVERFHRPAIVIAKREKYSKGSARSIEGFNIIEALRQFEKDFINLGGHPAAAGFTIETKNLSKLAKKLENLVSRKIPDSLLSPVLVIDCQIEFPDITQKLYQQIEKFEPFGMGNPKPTFLIKNAQVLGARQVGSEGRHLKLKIKPSSINHDPLSILDAIFFGGGSLLSRINSHKSLNVIFNIDENEWNGNKTLQLLIKDIDQTVNK